MSSGDGLTIWLVDPISYSGMAYTDAAQILALETLGTTAVLAGSDDWMLEPGIIPRRPIFRRTSGRRARTKKGLAYLGSLVRLVSAVRAARPDVVHWQYTELPLADLAAVTAMRALGVHQVYTAHELLPWTSRPYHPAVFRALYGSMDAVIVHDRARRDELVTRFSVDPARVRVIPLGDYSPFVAPDMSQAAARGTLGLPSEVPIALFFGAIRPSKGLDVLLEAWPLVVRKVPEAILMVAGKPFKGIDTQAVAARIRQAGVSGSVHTEFRQVSPAETNLYYRAADVVVLPYHAIGTSGVLRYAYNSRRPVVATSVGEHTRHVVPDQTGTLVPPGDPVALGEALVDALCDRARLEHMGAVAGKYAVDHFGWSSIARSMLDLYQAVAARAARGDPSRSRP